MVVAVTAARKPAEGRGGVVREAAVVRRRRPGLWVAGAGLVVVSALAALSLVGSAGHRVPVLAVARTVHIGQKVSPADLVVARVAADQALRPVPASDRGQVVGKTAAVELRAGSLLTADAVTDAAVPVAGQELVGVAVKAGQWPARGLVAGDRVLAVAADEPGDGATGGGMEPVPAVVWDVGGSDVDGAVTVDLIVPAASGPRLAQRGAAGRVALVLLPVGG